MQAIHDIMSPGDQTFEGSQSGGYENIETSESLKRERDEHTLPVPDFVRDFFVSPDRFRGWDLVKQFPRKKSKRIIKIFEQLQIVSSLFFVTNVYKSKSWMHFSVTNSLDFINNLNIDS